MNIDKDRIINRTILRAVVGSTAHGLNLPGADDRDEMGVCIEPIEYTAGLTQFEQIIYRTAEERRKQEIKDSQAAGNSWHPILHKDGHTPRSLPGDLDLTIYSLRKFVKLALKGNPSILALLYVQAPGTSTRSGWELQALAPKIVSRRALGAFLGYMQSQRQRLTGDRGGKHGVRVPIQGCEYDTKYAMHILRLGMQGKTLAEEGRLWLPMKEMEREILMRVRRGEVALSEVLDMALALESKIKLYLDNVLKSILPDKPNTEYVENWLVATYENAWRCD